MAVRVSMMVITIANLSAKQAMGRKLTARTITSYMIGELRENSKTRNEFLNIVSKK